jgi:hypothetical protein
MKRTFLSFIALAFVLLAVGAAFFVMRGKRAQPSMPVTTSTPPGAAPGEAAVTPRGSISIDPRRQQLIGVRTVPAAKTTVTPAIGRSVHRPAETKVTTSTSPDDDPHPLLTSRAAGAAAAAVHLYSPDQFATETGMLALKARDQLQ